MIKKIAAIFVALLCATGAWATDYKGVMTINASTSSTSSGDEQVSKNDVLVTVELNANGTYHVVLHDFSLLHKGVLYDIGTLEYDQLEGTTRSNGYTYVNGTRPIGVKDIQGYENLIPEYYRQFLPNLGEKTFDVDFAGRFNSSMMIAQISTEITLTASYYGATATVFHTIMNIDYVGYYVEPVLKAGDLDGDGKVDVSDVNAVINIILKAKTESDYKGKADVTGDGKVDVSDVNEIINMILKA